MPLYTFFTNRSQFRLADIMAHQEEFVQLDTCIERFKQSLPVPERLQSPSVELLHGLLVVHTLSQCASIQLHVRFVMQSSTSRSRCLAAANSIVRTAQVLPVQQMRFISPIMAVSVRCVLCPCSCLRDLLRAREKNADPTVNAHRSSSLPAVIFCWVALSLSGACVPHGPRPQLCQETTP